MLDAFDLPLVDGASALAVDRLDRDSEAGTGKRKKRKAPAKSAARKDWGSQSLAAYLTQQPLEEQDSYKVSSDPIGDDDEDDKTLSEELDRLALGPETSVARPGQAKLRRLALEFLLQKYFLYIFVKHLSSAMLRDSASSAL